MILNRLAWKNIWRHKRRTLLTGFSISFGVFLATTFTGIGDYTYTNMIDASATMGLGHVTVEPQGYNLAPSLDKRLQNASQIQQKIGALPQVTQTNIRIMGQAMFASASKSIGGSFMAIDPTTETPDANLFIKSIVEGELFKSADHRGIAIGSIMAEKLNLQIGKKIVYTTTDIDGEIVGEVARISAIFHTGLDEVDGAMALLPINRMRETLSYHSDDASMITVQISDQREAEKVRRAVGQMVDEENLEILSWEKTQGDMKGFVTLKRGSQFLMELLIGLVIAAGILNTILMGVIERGREFAVMIAVGMAPSRLFWLVMVEAFWLAIIGLIIGIIITAPWFYYLFYTGLDYSAMMESMQEVSAGGVLFDPLIRIRLFKGSIIAILSGVFLLTIFSALYPAWRAMRTDAVDNLKTI